MIELEMSKSVVRKALKNAKVGQKIVASTTLRKGLEYIYIDHDDNNLLVVQPNSKCLGILPIQNFQEIFFTEIVVEIPEEAANVQSARASQV